MESLEKTVKNIKSLRIQGARSIALAGLRVLKDIAEEKGFKKEFGAACSQLVNARPTAVPLYNAVKKIQSEKNLEAIDDLIYYFEHIGRIIAPHGMKIIKENSTVLTHCHSSVVVSLFKYVHERKKFRVIVTETRPLYQGDLTAKDLHAAGVPVTLIVDSAAGYFVDCVDAIIMGSDAIRKNGVVNKIGSYMLAVVAKENKIPVYFVGETMKFDRRKEIKIEERSVGEIIQKSKLRGCEIRNPAFDLTPWKYITAVVTEKGLMTPRHIIKELMRSEI
jgi:ribose 1,5-bisphosphate isomerase